jgi:hypothetical protein
VEWRGMVWNLLSLGAAGAFATIPVTTFKSSSPQASPSARNQYTQSTHPLPLESALTSLPATTLLRRLLGKPSSVPVVSVSTTYPRLLYLQG